MPRELTQDEREHVDRLIEKTRNMEEDLRVFWMATYAELLDSGDSPQEAEKNADKIVNELDVTNYRAGSFADESE